MTVLWSASWRGGGGWNSAFDGGVHTSISTSRLVRPWSKGVTYAVCKQVRLGGGADGGGVPPLPVRFFGWQ